MRWFGHLRSMIWVRSAALVPWGCTNGWSEKEKVSESDWKDESVRELVKGCDVYLGWEGENGSKVSAEMMGVRKIKS
jgi:hypothetical protein